MKKHILSCMVLVLFCGSVSAQSSVCGRVFVDRNDNGFYEQGERLLSGIPVSNGDTVVVTDRDGRFALTLPDSIPTTVFAVLPPEYGLSANARPNDIVVRAEANVDFGVLRQKPSKRFRAAFIGDVHVEDSTMFNYFRRTIIDRLLSEKGIDQNIWLGDLVNESPEWHRPLAEVMSVLPQPSCCVMGNHDFDDRRGLKKEQFMTSFGGDTYAFRRGEVCFVVLNNSRGEYRDSDLRLLCNLSRVLPTDCLMVVCQHIPLQYAGRGDEMQRVLESLPQRVLMMSAHEHFVMRRRYSERLTDQIVGSVCSVWWRGTKNEDWLPHSLQQCGAPRNFFTVDFDGADYSIAYHAIGSDEQMRVWVEGEDPTDSTIGTLAAMERGSVVANLFGGDDETVVTMCIDGGVPVAMEHRAVVDPFVLRLAALSKSYTERKDPRRAPYLRAPSPHTWTTVLPDGLTGVHKLTFRAVAPNGFTTEYSMVVAR